MSSSKQTNRRPQRIYLNGKILPADRAVLPVCDRAFLYGDGVFETLRAYAGIPFYVEAHLTRLRRSARLLRIPVPWTNQTLQQGIRRTLTANGLRAQGATLRVMVTRGVGAYGLVPRKMAPPSLVVMAFPFASRPKAAYRNGVPVVLSTAQKIDPRALPVQMKSLNMLGNQLALEEAVRCGAAEALLCNARGEVCEGSVSNLFIVQRGGLCTPPARSVLPGITRQIVLTLAKRLKLPCVERAVTKREVFSAQECFLTNTSMEILPVRSIDGRQIKGACPGSVTRCLQEAFAQEVVRYSELRKK